MKLKHLKCITFLYNKMTAMCKANCQNWVLTLDSYGKHIKCTVVTEWFGTHMFYVPELRSKTIWSNIQWEPALSGPFRCAWCHMCVSYICKKSICTGIISAFICVGYRKMQWLWEMFILLHEKELIYDIVLKYLKLS